MADIDIYVQPGVVYRSAFGVRRVLGSGDIADCVMGGKDGFTRLR